MDGISHNLLGCLSHFVSVRGFLCLTFSISRNHIANEKMFRPNESLWNSLKQWKYYIKWHTTYVLWQLIWSQFIIHSYIFFFLNSVLLWAFGNCDLFFLICWFRNFEATKYSDGSLWYFGVCCRFVLALIVSIYMISSYFG